MLEEAWRRFKKPSSASSKHLSEELLLLPVVLCLEDLKSVSITERSCRELCNNHLQIWQSKIRILILQFISFDILSVISPFPHDVFTLGGRWHVTYSLDCWERQLFLSHFFSPSQSLSLSLFSFYFFSPWFLLSLPASFVALLKEKEESCCLQLDIKYCSRENAHDEGFSHVAHNEVRVSQYVPSGVVSLYFKPRSKLCSFHFQRA